MWTKKLLMFAALSIAYFNHIVFVLIEEKILYTKNSGIRSPTSFFEYDFYFNCRFHDLSSHNDILLLCISLFIFRILEIMESRILFVIFFWKRKKATLNIHFDLMKYYIIKMYIKPSNMTSHYFYNFLLFCCLF